MEIDGFAGAAATGDNARRNGQATEEGQTGCADSASLKAASKAACTDKPRVTLDKSARLGESPQSGTVMWGPLSTQSLNQFAEKVSRADALCAEIACIHRNLRGNASYAVPVRADSMVQNPHVGKARKRRHLYTPARI